MSTELLPWVEALKEDFSLVNRARDGTSVWWGVHHAKVGELQGLIRLMLGDVAVSSPGSPYNSVWDDLCVRTGGGNLLVLYRMTNPTLSSRPWYVSLDRLNEASKDL